MLGIDEFILKQWFSTNRNDSNLYVLNGDEGVVIVILYVDDILLTSNNSKEIEKVKLALKYEFEVKDLGNACLCLNIEMCWTEDRVVILQKKKIKDWLHNFNMQECKTISTPNNISVNLIKKILRPRQMENFIKS